MGKFKLIAILFSFALLLGGMSTEIQAQNTQDLMMEKIGRVVDIHKERKAEADVEACMFSRRVKQFAEELELTDDEAGYACSMWTLQLHNPLGTFCYGIDDSETEAVVAAMSDQERQCLDATLEVTNLIQIYGNSISPERATAAEENLKICDGLPSADERWKKVIIKVMTEINGEELPVDED